MRRRVRFSLVAMTVIAACVGCGDNATFLSPSFINYAVGGIVPLVPGADSGFILVRVVNNTPNNIRFVVTAEREVTTIGDDGVETVSLETETVRLQTFPANLANESGILFNCPVRRVGLGENIDFPTSDPGLFIGAIPGENEGFGVPGYTNPLSAQAGNFACGDTLIFETSVQAGTVGNVRVLPYILDAGEQPDQVTGPDTFGNARTVIEEYSLQE
ncbi:MAG: hypothetical protein GY842_06190 [bacterium]|nr:hypothetical protein [bacterium]